MREMKNSGIEWIGIIPSDRVKCKIKNVCAFIGSGTTPSSHNLSFYDGDIFWIQSGDLYGTSFIQDTSVKVTKLATKVYSTLKIYKSPYIVMAMYGGSVGNISISLIDACVNQATCCLQPNFKIYLKFLYYWLVFCKVDFLSLAAGGGQPNISQNKIKNEVIFVPGLNEQKAIANYLDIKCTEIDALSDDIQTQIDTLEQYKKSTVFEAVVRGIQCTVMKSTDSDVWSSIPQNWFLVDIKYLFEIVKRIAGKEGYDILAVTQKGIKVKDISNNEGQIAANYSGYQLVYPTDYVMNHMDLLTGWVDCSTKFGVTSPDYRVFRLKNKGKYDLGYYKYVMQCCYMCRIFYSLGRGVSNFGRWRLPTSVFLNFKVPVPPIEEQRQICNYLDTTCAKIDAIIAQKQEQLAVLADYKKSLIYEYVTGKKEVPQHE